MGEGTAAARAQVLAAREALDEELLRLEASARAAVDIPAKVRRNPVKAAGVAAGVGFVAVGGPRRLLGRAKRAVLGPDEPLPEQMLPEEIEKSLKRLGKDGNRVRGLLEHEFATYLRKSEKERKGRDLQGILTAAVLAVGRPVIMRTAKQVGEQLLNPDSDLFREQLEKVRARRDAAQAEAEAARAEADALAEADAEIQGL